MTAHVAVAFTLPWPPSLNTYWRSVVVRGQSRVLLSQEGREYRKSVVTATPHSVRRRFAGRLSVTLTVSPPDRRRRDLDNLPKGILDALRYAQVYLDDSQIDYLVIERRAPTEGGSVGVSVAELVA